MQGAPDPKCWQIYKVTFAALLALAYAVHWPSFVLVVRQNLIADRGWDLLWVQVYLLSAALSLFTGLLGVAFGRAPKVSLLCGTLGVILINLYAGWIYPMTQVPTLYLFYFILHDWTHDKSATGPDPFWVVRQIFGAVYLNSFLNKVLVGGSAWIAGDILREDLILSHLEHGGKLALYLSNSAVLPRIVTIFTLMFEGLAPILIFANRLNLAVFALGILLHAGIAILLRANFLWFYFPCYLAFLDFQRLKKVCAAIQSNFFR